MKKQHPTVVLLLHSLFIFAAAIIGMMYAEFHGLAALFNPLYGAAIGLYLVYQKKAFPAIFGGVTLAVIVYRIVVLDESIWITLAVLLFVVLGIVIDIVVYSFLVVKTKLDLSVILHVKYVSRLVGIALFVAFIGSIIPFLGYYLIWGAVDLQTMYFSQVIGTFSGIIVFSSLTVNAYNHDNEVSLWSVNGIFSAVYVIVFITINVLVFNELFFGLSYEVLTIIFVILYIIGAYVFPFRMIIANNLIVLFMFNIVIYQTIEVAQQGVATTNITMVLVVLSILSNTIKTINTDLYNRNTDLVRSSNLLEQIILSTNNLFNVQDGLPKDKEEFAKQYLSDMFKIACDIYPKFDFATCFVQGDQTVEFLGAQGYDVEHINSLKFNPEVFVWTFHVPEIVVETKYKDAFPIEGNFADFRRRYPEIVESIRFTIHLGDEWFGGMSFDIVEGNQSRFDQIDLDNFLSFQNVVNSYFSVGTLNTQNNSLKDDIVLSLVHVLELYDSYTGTHSTDVADLAVEIATGLLLPDSEIRRIYWASIVHDIGKIGVNSDILNTPDRLTEMEFEIVKQHTIFGANILGKSEGLKDIAKTVRHHHEWWDGNGYPDGLRSIDIPYSSQIIQVCDAVAAMSSNRVYSKTMSEAEIIKQLQDGLGKQFSPKVCKYMIQYIQDGHFTTFLETHNIKGE